MNWFVYIVECSDKSYYTGITINLERRINEHNSSNTVCSRYVRSRRPSVLVFSQIVHSRGKALKREAEIKKLSRFQKQQLIENSSMVDHPA